MEPLKNKRMRAIRAIKARIIFIQFKKVLFLKSRILILGNISKNNFAI
jgi:hypothetical protein